MGTIFNGKSGYYKGLTNTGYELYDKMVKYLDPCFYSLIQSGYYRTEELKKLCDIVIDKIAEIKPVKEEWKVPHSCPFAEEIHGDYSDNYCECSEYDTHQCAMSI